MNRPDLTEEVIKILKHWDMPTRRVVIIDLVNLIEKEVKESRLLDFDAKQKEFAHLNQEIEFLKRSK